MPKVRKRSGWRGKHKRCEVEGCNKRVKYNNKCSFHFNNPMVTTNSNVVASSLSP